MPNKVAHVVILLLCTGDHLPARRKKSHTGKRQRKALGASKSSPPGACTCLCRPDQRQSVRKKRKKKAEGRAGVFGKHFLAVTAGRCGAVAPPHRGLRCLTSCRFRFPPLRKLQSNVLPQFRAYLHFRFSVEVCEKKRWE